MDFHWQPVNRLVCEIHKKDSFYRPHIQTVVAYYQGRDILADTQFGNTKGHHLAPIVAAQPIVGSEPYITILILYNTSHSIGSQPVIHCNLTVAVIILSPSRQEYQNSCYQQNQLSHDGAKV